MVGCWQSFSISQALGCRREGAADVRHEGIDEKAPFIDGSVAWRRGFDAPVVLLPLSHLQARVGYTRVGSPGKSPFVPSKFHYLEYNFEPFGSVCSLFRRIGQALLSFE